MRIISAFLLSGFLGLAACGTGSNPNCDQKLGACLDTSANGKPKLTGINQAPPPPIPGDGDGDGWPDCDLEIFHPAWPCDCDDADAAIAPDRPEVCDDEDRIDEDCDNLANELDVNELVDWGFDGDGDGYGRWFELEFADGDTDDPLALVYTGQGAFPGCDARVLAASFMESLFRGEIHVDYRTMPLAQIDYDEYGNAVIDCNDLAAFTYPGATEVCDEVDNDCDGDVDEGAADPDLSFADGDGDGYGAGGPYASCEVPDGYVGNDQDCDDADPTISPEAEEVPGDGIDQNCDGLDLCYADADGDGYGSGEPLPAPSCVIEGWSPNALDCNDADAAIHPSAPEDACDGADNNCNTLIDGADTDLVGLSTFWADGDGDGFGDSGSSTLACTLSEGWVDNSEDCNDADPSISPDATEVCDPDNIDENCNGSADDADPTAMGQTTWYADVDEDGYGSSTVARESCEQPSRSSTVATDCDDFDAEVNPGATEVLYDDVDNDCNPETEDDACQQSLLSLSYYPGVGVMSSDDVQVWVKTLTADPGDVEVYEQWTTGMPEGTTVYTEADGVTAVNAVTCVDGTNEFRFRIIHNGLPHCDSGSSLFAWMDGSLLSASYVIDPIDELCAQQSPLVP